MRILKCLNCEWLQLLTTNLEFAPIWNLQLVGQYTFRVTCGHTQPSVFFQIKRRYADYLLRTSCRGWFNEPSGILNRPMLQGLLRMDHPKSWSNLKKYTNSYVRLASDGMANTEEGNNITFMAARG